MQLFKGEHITLLHNYPHMGYVAFVQVSTSLYYTRVCAALRPACSRSAIFPPAVEFFPLRRYEEPLGDLEGLSEQGTASMPECFSRAHHSNTYN